MNIQSRRGVTLIEVLMVVVISAIAMFALVPPFLAEGSLFRKGKRQTEAQRDAQMALRAMGFAARESNSAEVTSGATFTQVRFNSTVSPTPSVCFRGFTGGALNG